MRVQTTGDERRTFPRHSLHAAIGIETHTRKNRVGVTRNLSATGVLFHTASRLEVGERLEVKFRARPFLEGETETSGRVVRIWCELPREKTLFPNVVAVAFDEPVDGIATSSASENV